MKIGWKKLGKYVGWVFWTACLAGVVTVAADLVLGYLEKPLSFGKFLALGLALTLGLLPWRRLTVRLRRNLALVVAALALLIGLAGWGAWRGYAQTLIYAQVDDGKQALYADRQVMVIVPHEDDELNIAGGVLEEYVRYGSQVRVVFVTNGDFYGQGKWRIGEAVAYAKQVGIPEENLIFLGYGDQWAEGGPHIYNAQAGQVMTSAAGYQATYGSRSHPAYRKNRAYTRENLLEDLRSVIEEYRPDTILCSDYDDHIDHKAVTLAFEKVMGQLLAAEPDYTPVVYKAFAYNTAWMAPWDFYGENLSGTEYIFAPPYNQKPEVYRWEDRLRLPVSAGSLSRSLITTGNFGGLCCYGSQNERGRAAALTSSDKVFWQRRTDSKCYQAQIAASSGKAELLNDFMLLESEDLVSGRAPYDGVWTPEESDTQAAATVTFPQATDVVQIVLYDHPDEEINVLDACITFDDGSRIHTGPLDPRGVATVVAVEKKQVRWFAVALLERQGLAGLTEIEAYSTEDQNPIAYVKLTDGGENFVYDLWTDPEGVQPLGIYSVGAEEETWSLECQGEDCEARLEQGRITVTCPEGASCTVTVRNADGSLRDSVVIRNPGAAARKTVRRLQGFEEQLFSNIRYTVTVKAFGWAARRLSWIWP